MTLLEAFTVTLICFGWAIFSSLEAVAAWSAIDAAAGASTASADTFSDGSMISLIIIELIMATIALAFLTSRSYDIRSLLPSPSSNGLVIGAGLYAMALAIFWVLGPLLQHGAAEPIQAMVQGATVSVPTVLVTAIVNGTYEEVFLLGFLARGLERFGTSIALGAPLLIRLLYHLYQGPVAATFVCFVGLLWGLYYLRSGRLFPVVCAHILSDTVPFLWH
ncbi:MAG TPA: CPBP family intramembrane glutamic endopeptidase [Rhodocyclaceae bacterium]|nr:CPBP family intramembrane glutamic endopeptidase [Rhodocyclaceae bacterium]